MDLVLTGRTGRIPRPQDLHALAHTGCLVTLYAGDASMAETARGLVHCAGSHEATLGGVLHAAGLQVQLCLHSTENANKTIQTIYSRIWLSGDWLSGTQSFAS
jgi:hypothetical protein